MTVIYACGAALVLVILFFIYALARTAKGSPEQQRASDDEQVEALLSQIEFEVQRAMERDLFATK